MSKKEKTLFDASTLSSWIGWMGLEEEAFELHLAGLLTSTIPIIPTVDVIRLFVRFVCMCHLDQLFPSFFRNGE